MKNPAFTAGLGSCFWTASVLSYVRQRTGPWRAPALAGLLMLAGGTAVSADPADLPPKPATAESVAAATRPGALSFRLTTPDELRGLVGQETRARNERRGDHEVLTLEFPDAQAVFARPREFSGPFTLYEMTVKGRAVDIGEDRPLLLRTEADLEKLDSFSGAASASLAKLDLRSQLARLRELSFDSLTEWPGPEKLPAGFDPARLLEAGKDPGLGIRQLHAAGMDGRGVGIAIIDQPLLRDHEEYRERLVRYEPVEVEGVGPQMHGPAVASIAVGKSCGVAPQAALYFFAIPSWKWTRNEPYAEQLERIVELNQGLKDTPRIKVVSISLGAFSERPNFERWQQAVRKAEEQGILVVTCDWTFLKIATLKRNEERPGTAAEDYGYGRYAYPGAQLAVPAANRTIASPRGPRAYTYDRNGGMSWTVPYLAGLAALAWQVNPAIQPKEVVRLWRETPTPTKAGHVVNPSAFIEAVKARLERKL